MSFRDDRTINNTITAGRHTLVPADMVCGIELELGAFTSIASGVRIVSGQHPPVDYPAVVSTFPFLEHGWGDYPPSRHSGKVTIGNDVWVGENVTFLDGVRIGNGAIIGACAVVASDVPDYAIVVGNPAKVRRLRFDPETIRRLLEIAWWNWPDEQIKAELPRLMDSKEFADIATDLDPIALDAYARLANQRTSELSWLLRILRARRIGQVLEIGSQDGGTLWAWSQIAPGATILSVDWEGNVKAGPWEVIVADSHDPQTAQRVREWFDGPVDFLFIDGDHSPEGVRADLMAYSPLVSAGGLMAFHDIDGQTSEFWAWLKHSYPDFRTDEFIDPVERSMGIGVVYL